MTQERMSSAAFRARQGLPPPGTTAGVVQVSKAKPQVHLPKPVTMTKTEESCMRLLQSLYPPTFFEVLFEPWSFKLPSGCRYCPDFVVMDGAKIVEVTESKGSRILNGHTIRAFKEARAAFPKLNFVLRQRREGEWTEAS